MKKGSNTYPNANKKFVKIARVMHKLLLGKSYDNEFGGLKLQKLKDIFVTSSVLMLKDLKFPLLEPWAITV